MKASRFNHKNTTPNRLRESETNETKSETEKTRGKRIGTPRERECEFVFSKVGREERRRKERGNLHVRRSLANKQREEEKTVVISQARNELETRREKENRSAAEQWNGEISGFGEGRLAHGLFQVAARKRKNKQGREMKQSKAERETRWLRVREENDCTCVLNSVV